MGFFSRDCNGCGHPLLSAAATDPINRWMTEAVAIKPDGIIVTGDYDGYGNVMGGCTHPALLDEAGDEMGCPCESGEPTFSWDDSVTTWHAACWKLSGSPTENRGESRNSADQGWFFGPEDHAVAEPQTVEDMVAAKVKGDALHEPVDEDAALADFIAQQAELPRLQKP